MLDDIHIDIHIDTHIDIHINPHRPNWIGVGGPGFHFASSNARGN